MRNSKRVLVRKAASVSSADAFIMQNKDAWAESHIIFSKVLQAFKPSIGVELGVAFGGHAEHMLSSCHFITKLWCVDPYRPYPDPFMNRTQDVMDKIHTFAAQRIARLGRGELLRLTSVEAAEKFEKASIDFIYIDAEHTAKAVREDIATWYPKIKSGGLLAGHDYKHGDFPGLTDEVHAFVASQHLKLVHPGEHVWYVVKP